MSFSGLEVCKLSRRSFLRTIKAIPRYTIKTCSPKHSSAQRARRIRVCSSSSTDFAMIFRKGCFSNSDPSRCVRRRPTSSPHRLIAQGHNHAVLTERLTLSPTTGSAGCTEAAGPTWLKSWPDFCLCSWAGFVKLYRFMCPKFHCFNLLIDFHFNQAYSESSQGWDTRCRVHPSLTSHTA